MGISDMMPWDLRPRCECIFPLFIFQQIGALIKCMHILSSTFVQTIGLVHSISLLKSQQLCNSNMAEQADEHAVEFWSRI